MTLLNTDIPRLQYNDTAVPVTVTYYPLLPAPVFAGPSQRQLDRQWGPATRGSSHHE